MTPLRICRNGRWYYLLRFPDAGEGPPEALMKGETLSSVCPITDNSSFSRDVVMPDTPIRKIPTPGVRAVVHETPSSNEPPIWETFEI